MRYAMLVLTGRTKLVRKFSSFLFCLLLWLGTLLPQGVAGEGSYGLVLEIKGAIGPAVSNFICKGLEKAVTEDAEVVILMLDTPGGLDLAMRDIIQTILNSSVPVVTYVSPAGARAASAGTYILYASHIAAMAPTTNLGAATPVKVIGLPGTQDFQEKDKNTKESTPSPVATSPMDRKMVNDSAAYIRSLADRYGRNADWAEKAVREAVSLTAGEALEMKVIDVVAKDLPDLLSQVNGREVVMKEAGRILATDNLNTIYFIPTWKDKLLAIIGDPNLAYLLMLLGVYGLIYELANPGFFFPGVAGAISILLAFYGFQILPINYSGLALIFLGIFLIISEVFVPSFGSLGIGGIIAFIVGSLILVDEQSMRISLALILSISLFSAGFLLWVMGRVVTLRRKPVRTGGEVLVGMTGEVVDDFIGDGRIWLVGESWQAKSAGKMKKGQKVKVVVKKGLILTVETLREEQ